MHHLVRASPRRGSADLARSLPLARDPPAPRLSARSPGRSAPSRSAMRTGSPRRTRPAPPVTPAGSRLLPPSRRTSARRRRRRSSPAGRSACGGSSASAPALRRLRRRKSVPSFPARAAARSSRRARPEAIAIGMPKSRGPGAPRAASCASRRCRPTRWCPAAASRTRGVDAPHRRDAACAPGCRRGSAVYEPPMSETGSAGPRRRARRRSPRACRCRRRGSRRPRRCRSR